MLSICFFFFFILMERIMAFFWVLFFLIIFSLRRDAVHSINRMSQWVVFTSSQYTHKCLYWRYYVVVCIDSFIDDSRWYLATLIYVALERKRDRWFNRWRISHSQRFYTYFLFKAFFWGNYSLVVFHQTQIFNALQFIYEKEK